MTDKTFGDLSRAGSLSGNELFAIENGDGNSRAILASRVRNYMGATVAALLTTHEADTTTHGISTFVATLTSAANATAFLTLLGFTNPAEGAFTLPGGILVQYGKESMGASGSNTDSGTFSLPTSFADTDYTIVASASGTSSGGRAQFDVTCGAAGVDTASWSADTGDDEAHIDNSRDLMWIAIGNAP